MKALKSPETVSLKSKCKFCQADVLNKHVLKYHYDKVHREEEAKARRAAQMRKNYTLLSDEPEVELEVSPNKPVISTL